MLNSLQILSDHCPEGVPEKDTRTWASALSSLKSHFSRSDERTFPAQQGAHFRGEVYLRKSAAALVFLCVVACPEPVERCLRGENSSTVWLSQSPLPHSIFASNDARAALVFGFPFPS